MSKISKKTLKHNNKKKKQPSLIKKPVRADNADFTISKRKYIVDIQDEPLVVPESKKELK